MARVTNFCIDRYEASMVDRKTLEPLSPYYPPKPALMAKVVNLWRFQAKSSGNEALRPMPLPDISEWQRTHAFEPKAVSKRGVVPQGYVSYHVAEEACRNAGKRLCSAQEWITACRGQRSTRHPYGDVFLAGTCNVYRAHHPAALIQGSASVGHTDPRLNLVVEGGTKPLLALTGSYSGCVSVFGTEKVYDLVGNLDEWVADASFRGGFYARSTTRGCEAEVRSHAPAYYDYSTGARCCQDAR